jgi:hypothetical protein
VLEQRPALVLQASAQSFGSLAARKRERSSCNVSVWLFKKRHVPKFLGGVILMGDTPSGTGASQVPVSVERNNGGARAGTITSGGVGGGVTVRVEQEGERCDPKEEPAHFG